MVVGRDIRAGHKREDGGQDKFFSRAPGESKGSLVIFFVVCPKGVELIDIEVRHLRYMKIEVQLPARSDKTVTAMRF